MRGEVSLTRGLDSGPECPQGSGVGFRLLMLPGVAAFWPMLLRRWTRGIAEPPVEKNPHRLFGKQRLDKQ